MKTSKRKLFYSSGIGHDVTENRIGQDISSNNHKNLSKRKIVKDENAAIHGLSSSTATGYSITVTPQIKQRVYLTERQQVAILLQQSTPINCQSVKSPRTPHDNRRSTILKEIKGRLSSRITKRGRRLNKRNERGETPLHLATIRGDIKQVQRLICLGADVNCPDFAGWTPLHEACNHGWLRIGQHLLKAGADVDAKGFDDFTPLHDAAVNGHSELVELLLQHAACISPKNVHGKTPLILATCPKVIDILKKINSLDLKTRTADGNDGVIARDAQETCSRIDDDDQLTASTCISLHNMRKSSPPQHQTPKGSDKPSSPRLTLRFQPIKSREERHGAVAVGGSNSSSSSSGNGGNNGGNGCSASSKGSEVTSSEPRYQSYCVTMETTEVDDVYEFKKDPNEEGTVPPAPPSLPSSSSTNTTHHRSPSSASSSTSSAISAGAIVAADDHFDQQLNVVSSTKDATLRLQQTNIESTMNNNNNNNNNRSKTNENHVIRSASKIELHDANLVSAEQRDVDEGGVCVTGENERDDGKRKRKRDSKDETVNKNVSSGSLVGVSGSSGGGGGMSLRNHSVREKSLSEDHAECETNNPGSETESTHSDAENEAPEQPTQGGLPKVPPLKIVIPPTAEQDRSRVASRHSLPYIVNSSEDSKGLAVDGNGNGASTTTTTTTTQAPSDSKENHHHSATPVKDDVKSRDTVHSEERSQRVTRSSQRAAMAGTGSSGVGSNVALTPSLQNLQDYVGADCAKINKFDDGLVSNEEQNGTEMPPRKRKLRPRGIEGGPSSDGNSVNHSASSASSSSSSSVSSHYEEQPMYLNCYEMFLNLRRQIDRRHTSMFVVQPKAPQGFKDYLMNKCSYVLAGNAASRLSVPMIPPPQSLTGLMKELYVAQEKARYSLRLQHIIEREKLTLAFEQETLRVHGRAARAMANQTVPLSVCTILKDEEVYNQIEPEQEEKERNARTRFNGRLFLSWQQDVDDKWDKVKKAMLLRHHNEAESLHAAQKLDWEWKMKELGICDSKSTPAIDVIHVPIVHVSDDFDLLPT